MTKSHTQTKQTGEDKPDKITKCFVMDGDTELTVIQIAKRVDLTKEVIRDYIKRIGVKTLDGIFERKELMTTKKGPNSSKVHETIYGKFTTREIYERHEFRETISVPMLSGRICRRGAMCPSLWWEKMKQHAFRKRLVAEGLEQEIRVAPPERFPDSIKPFAFPKRTTHCFADHQPCKKYKECCDYREKHGEQSPLFNKKGCWEEEVHTAWGGGDRTNNHDCNESRCLHSG